MSDTQRKVSPIVAIAAGSVIVFSAAGVGVMTGLIPSSFSNTQPYPEQPAAAAPAVSAPPAAAPAPRAARPSRAEEAPRVARQNRAHEAPKRAERTHVAAARTCAGCGTVKSVNVVEKAGEGTGLGAIGGAVVGGVLGNQIGDGSGRRIATVAGAAGGGYAGHQAEKHFKSTKTWNVQVRMEDGSSRTFPYASDPGLHAGDPVRVANGQLARR
jgi:outer membrane lipoprotein SlyB